LSNIRKLQLYKEEQGENMSVSDHEQIRQGLLKLQAELLELEDTSRQAAQTVELDQASVGRLSRMDALQSQQMAKESVRRRQLMLAKIESALQRLVSGGYGLCFECGEAINPRRLAVDPTCTLCIDCAR